MPTAKLSQKGERCSVMVAGLGEFGFYWSPNKEVSDLTFQSK
ncbi:MAG TPA: hypothetical protein VGQ53_20510 [Chitinophagaceae bacterium]|nr:hypothetical protein [Chitinophagaceae bacterium]